MLGMGDNIYFLIMACLMNISIHAIFSKAKNTEKSLVKQCTFGLMALTSVAVCRFFESLIIFAANPYYTYSFSVISQIVFVLKYIFIFYVPFILTLLSIKEKRFLIAVPLFVESASIIVAINAMRYRMEMTAWGIMLITISTVYVIRMFIKLGKLMSVWTNNKKEPIKGAFFVKKFIWGILFGICFSSWLAIIYGSYMKNSLVLSIAMLIGCITLLVASLLLYFIPTIVAVKRKHLQKIPIILINILLGWSLIGWIVALIWACMESKPKIVHIHNEVKSTDLGEKLQSLDELRKNGLITDEEYESKKSELLKNY